MSDAKDVADEINKHQIDQQDQAWRDTCAVYTKAEKLGISFTEEEFRREYDKIQKRRSLERSNG